MQLTWIGLVASVAIACTDGLAPVTVASIKARVADTSVFWNARLPASALFEPYTGEGILIVRPGVMTLSVTGEGWRITGDTLIAPAFDSWATVTARGGTVVASVRLGGVVDLRTKRFVYRYFCACVGGNCTSPHQFYRIDSISGTARIDRFAYNGDPEITSPSPSGIGRAVRGTSVDTIYRTNLDAQRSQVVSSSSTDDPRFTLSRQVPDTLDVMELIMARTQRTPLRYDAIGGPQVRSCFARPSQPWFITEQ